MPEPLLEVKDLKVCFIREGKPVTVAGPLSFNVYPSETLAIVGESGSGKTVTALSVLKLIPIPPGSIPGGTIVFNGDLPGQDLLKMDEKTMQSVRGRQISMIFQEPMTSLNPVMTCGKQVAEIIKVHMGKGKPETKSRVLQLFREVNLPDPERIYKAYPHEISGGQKQRVMIAMAIACNPGLLIADEPTTALDVTVQKTILELLKNLQKSRQMSIIFITHDLGLVSGFADRVLVMNKGQVVEEGPVSEIFRRPKTLYTQGLLACRPPVGVRPVRLPTVETFISKSNEDEYRKIITESERVELQKGIYSRKPVLEVRSVTRRFDKTQVLYPVSFDLYPGETLGIAGESGCGKTTLARVVLELIPPTEGNILFENEDITRLDSDRIRALRKKMQIIFQDPYSSLNPRKTIGSAILEPMRVHGLHGNDQERYHKVIDLLEKVGLRESHFNRFPHEFSGGQRQRICIARALAVEPKLIICDESVSALDVSVQAQALNLLNDLKKEFGLTMIFISHDLSVVKYMSDRIIIMKQGKIVEIGEADHLFKNPQSDYTKELLNSIPGKFPADNVISPNENQEKTDPGYR